MKYLVVFSEDWADEFQAEGFRIVTEDEKARILAWAPTGSFYFGTNEGFEDEDLTDAFTFSPITDEDEATLRKLFPRLSSSYSPKFGQFPHVDSMNLEDGDY